MNVLMRAPKTGRKLFRRAYIGQECSEQCRENVTGKIIWNIEFMIEILRTNDPVKLSYAMTLLTEAGCDPFQADQFTSSIEGSIGAIPRRILVPDDRVDAARLALKVLEENE